MQKVWWLVILLVLLLLIAGFAIVFKGFGQGISTFFGGTVLAGFSSGVTGIMHTVMVFGTQGFPQGVLVVFGSFALGFGVVWALRNWLWTPLKNWLSPESKEEEAPTMNEPKPTVVREKPVPTKEEETQTT